MLATAGAIQSNHTRQTAAAAAKCNLKCALLHFAWTQDAGPLYKRAGNILLSSIMDAELFVDEKERLIEDQSSLLEFRNYLQGRGNTPYLIPAGAAKYRLGSLGYLACAAEIIGQSRLYGVQFDYAVHCTGSSSTQAGLLAGFAAMGEKTGVIGISDDFEIRIKRNRVLQLANDTLAETGLAARVSESDVEIIAVDKSPYGVAESETFDMTKAAGADRRAYCGSCLRRQGITGIVGVGQFRSI